MKKKLTAIILALAFVALVPASAYAAGGSLSGSGSSSTGTSSSSLGSVLSKGGIPSNSNDNNVQLLEGIPSHGSKQEGKDGAVPYEQLTDAPNQSRFPKKVYLRDNTGTYNKVYEFYLLDGTLYLRKRQEKGLWKIAPQPDSLKGKINSISADGYQLLAAGPYNVLYQLHNAAQTTANYYWDHAWGGVFRVGDFYQAPNAKPFQWALSFITQDDDYTYTDIDGRPHPVSVTNLMQYVYIDPNNSANIVANDTWLPRDKTFTYGSPLHSRFKVAGLSAAASTAFVINKYGDMFIRTHDYDFSGGDPLQFPYTWETQSGKPDSTTFWEQRFSPTVAAVRLPSTPWIKISKIPGEITNRISIESTKKGNENRLLKVEGRKDGKTGFWQRNLAEDQSWKFVETGEPLKGTLLENSLADTSEKDLTPETGVNYKGQIAETGATLEVRDFAYNDNTQYASVSVGGVRVPATLYTEYGNLGVVVTQVITPHSQGLSDDPLRYNSALYLSPQSRTALQQTSEGQKFLQWFGDKDYHQLSVEATSGELKVTDGKYSVPKALTAQFSLKRE